jgi:hypothetical protein
MIVTNLFAYRATDPKDLRRLVADNTSLAIGSLNCATIEITASMAEAIVCAWGNHGSLSLRDSEVRKMLGKYDLYCIRLTIEGNPAHPVRERYTDAPVIYRTSRSAHDPNHEPSTASVKSANTKEEE